MRYLIRTEHRGSEMRRVRTHLVVALTACLAPVLNTSCSPHINYPVRGGSGYRVEPTGELGPGIKLQESGRMQKAYEWLRHQQMKNGLVRSYDTPGDNIAWTYDQPLAIIAFLVLGDVDAACRCADAMLEMRTELVVEGEEYRVWTDGYNMCTRKPESGNKGTGPNVWMGLALLHLHEATDNPVYLSAAEQVGRFVLAIRSSGGKTAGSVPGGYDESNKPFSWSSTEHNADCVGFLAALAHFTGDETYRRAAVEIVEWLDREMWNAVGGHYYPGYKDNLAATKSDFPELLDSQTWTILAVFAAEKWGGPAGETMQLLHNGLPWIDRHSSDVFWRGKMLRGHSKVTIGPAATRSLWTEGTAGYLLAASRIRHENPLRPMMAESLRCLQREDGSVPYSVGNSWPDVPNQFQRYDSVIADFEAHPNRLFGSVGVYGDGEPDWLAVTEAEFKEPYTWYYQSEKPDCNDPNVHSGRQSFRLVNAGAMCKYKKQGWATLGLDLGPAIGCRTVRPVDVSAYKKLVFWAKTDNPQGAKLNVIFRDTHRRSCDFKVIPTPCRLSKYWQQHTVDLARIRPMVDVRHLTHVALSFGKDAGNTPGTVIYVDDIAFTGSTTVTQISNGSEMPPVFPQHWPFGSVAGTTWWLFVELDINPFESLKKLTPIAASQYVSAEDKNYCRRYAAVCNIAQDWFGLSANLDASYRKTLFLDGDMDAKMFSWDTRADLWLPPFRQEFSWGLYARFSGITSNKDSGEYDWLNNRGANPGIGFQLYPFSSRTFREEGPDVYAALAETLGSLRLFVENNKIQYYGRQNSWRPDELVRVGADYWRDFYVDDVTKPCWGEIWSGLIWNSSNGWDNHYDSLIFANAVRLGIRKPDAGLLSMFTPYLAAESSLSENPGYAWENRLLLGGGLRFAPPLKFFPPQWNLTRFVVYGEYLNASAYYRSKPTKSYQDDDWRVGVNIYIGQWWPR